jgi:hypothetical protein
MCAYACRELNAKMLFSLVLVGSVSVVCAGLTRNQSISLESFQCHHQAEQLYVPQAHRIAEGDRMSWYEEAPWAMTELSKDLSSGHTNNYDEYEIEYPFNHDRFKMIGPVSAVCKTDLEHYGEGDSEKRVCGLKALEKMSSSCVVFSIGSNNEWGFEEA